MTITKTSLAISSTSFRTILIFQNLRKSIDNFRKCATDHHDMVYVYFVCFFTLYYPCDTFTSP